MRVAAPASRDVALRLTQGEAGARLTTITAKRRAFSLCTMAGHAVRSQTRQAHEERRCEVRLPLCGFLNSLLLLLPPQHPFSPTCHDAITERVLSNRSPSRPNRTNRSLFSRAFGWCSDSAWRKPAAIELGGQDRQGRWCTGEQTMQRKPSLKASAMKPLPKGGAAPRPKPAAVTDHHKPTGAEAELPPPGRRQPMPSISEPATALAPLDAAGGQEGNGETAATATQPELKHAQEAEGGAAQADSVAEPAIADLAAESETTTDAVGLVESPCRLVAAD